MNLTYLTSYIQIEGFGVVEGNEFLSNEVTRPLINEDDEDI